MPVPQFRRVAIGELNNEIEGRGLLDIASRPLHGPDKWNLYVWYNEGPRVKG